MSADTINSAYNSALGAIHPSASGVPSPTGRTTKPTSKRWYYKPYSGPPAITVDILARFWMKVTKSDGCWLWTAGLDDKGYGMFKLDGRMWKAPRVSWLIHHSDPNKLDVCHRCDAPACVNPAHLFIGTASDNMLDCARKGRLGQQNGLCGFGVSRSIGK